MPTLPINLPAGAAGPVVDYNGPPVLPGGALAPRPGQLYGPPPTTPPIIPGLTQAPPGTNLGAALGGAILAPNQTIQNYNMATGQNVPLIGSMPNITGMDLKGQNNYPMPNFQNMLMRAYAAKADLPGNTPTPWPVPGQSYYPGYNGAPPSGPIPPGGVPGGAGGGTGGTGGGAGGGYTGGGYPGGYPGGGGTGGGTGGTGGAGGGTGGTGGGTTPGGGYTPGEGVPGGPGAPDTGTGGGTDTGGGGGGGGGMQFNYWQDWYNGLFTNPNADFYNPITFKVSGGNFQNPIEFTNFYGDKLAPIYMKSYLGVQDDKAYQDIMFRLNQSLHNYLGDVGHYALGGKASDRSGLRNAINEIVRLYGTDQYGGTNYDLKSKLTRMASIMGMTQGSLFKDVDLKALTPTEAYLRDATAASWARFLGLEMKGTGDPNEQKDTRRRLDALKKWYGGMGGSIDDMMGVYNGVIYDNNIPQSTYREKANTNAADLTLPTTVPGWKNLPTPPKPPGLPDVIDWPTGSATGNATNVITNPPGSNAVGGLVGGATNVAKDVAGTVGGAVTNPTNTTTQLTNAAGKYFGQYNPSDFPGGVPPDWFISTTPPSIDPGAGMRWKWTISGWEKAPALTSTVPGTNVGGGTIPQPPATNVTPPMPTTSAGPGKIWNLVNGSWTAVADPNDRFAGLRDPNKPPDPSGLASGYVYRWNSSLGRWAGVNVPKPSSSPGSGNEWRWLNGAWQAVNKTTGNIVGGITGGNLNIPTPGIGGGSISIKNPF